MNKNIWFVGLFFVLTLVLFSNSVSAENWYLNKGLTSLNNFSSGTNQGFSYEYMNGSTVYYNMSVWSGGCGGGSGKPCWTETGASEVNPAVANRTDFAPFTAGNWLWFHPDVTQHVVIRFSPSILVTTNYNANVSYFLNAGGGTNFSIFINSIQGYKIYNLTQLAGSSSNKEFNFTLNQFESVIFLVDSLGNAGSDSSGIVLNISSGSAVVLANSTIRINDSFDTTTINNFTAMINGINYSTSNGLITTNYLTNSTNTVNITIFNATNNYGGYFNKTFTNYNLSANLNTELAQTEINFVVYEKVTNTSLSGSLWSSAVSKFTNQTFNFKATSYNVTFLNATYSSAYNKTQQYTFTPLKNTTYPLTNVYNTLINLTVKRFTDNVTTNVFSGNVSNSTYSFFESFTTTNGYKEIQAIKNINYTTLIEAENYTNFNLTGSAYLYPTQNTLNKTFFLYLLNTVNFLFFDQSTNTKITWKTITLELISDIFANNYTTTTGNLTMELLNPSDYTARYYANSYTTRFYYFTLDNNTYQTTTLYLINNTNYNNISINVLDQGTRGVENAYVKALKYDLASNSYILQEIGRTNVEGSTILTLTKYNEYYKFIVTYNDEILLTSNPAYITSDSLTFQINLGEGIGEKFYTQAGITYLTSFNTGTNNFRLDYGTISGLSTNVCFYTYKLTANSKTLTNSTCSTSATATLLLGIEPTNGTLYQAESYYLYSDGEYYLLDTMSYQYGNSDIFSKSGVIFQFLLTLAFALAVSWKPSYALVTVPISLLLGRVIGFINIGYEYIVPMIAIGIIISIMVRD